MHTTPAAAPKLLTGMRALTLLPAREHHALLLLDDAAPRSTAADAVGATTMLIILCLFRQSTRCNKKSKIKETCCFFGDGQTTSSRKKAHCRRSSRQPFAAVCAAAVWLLERVPPGVVAVSEMTAASFLFVWLSSPRHTHFTAEGLRCLKK
jgi:hypothetical protein